jgi:hypothetical protein
MYSTLQLSRFWMVWLSWWVYWGWVDDWRDYCMGSVSLRVNVGIQVDCYLDCRQLQQHCEFAVALCFIKIGNTVVRFSYVIYSYSYLLKRCWLQHTTHHCSDLTQQGFYRGNNCIRIFMSAASWGVFVTAVVPTWDGTSQALLPYPLFTEVFPWSNGFLLLLGKIMRVA